MGEVEALTTDTDALTAQIGSLVAREAWRDDPKRGFATLRDQCLAVMDYEVRGVVSPQLESLRMTAGSDEASGNSGPYGDFLVAPGFNATLLQVSAETDPVAGLVTRIPMGSPSIELPYRVDKDHATSVSGGLQVYRRATTQSVSAKRVAMGKLTLRVGSMMGISFAEEEILADSAISFAALLSMGYGEEFGAKKLDERISGVSASGEFQGVLTSPCLVTVSKESGQTSATPVLYENVTKMRSRCYGYGRAVWLAGPDLLPDLQKMNQQVGVGGVPAWQVSARDDAPDTLLGRPIYFTEFCKSRGSAGDLILGNWSQYLEGVLGTREAAESVHVRFEAHERAFKFVERNAGACWWDAPLKPRNMQSHTMSPFVVREAL